MVRVTAFRRFIFKPTLVVLAAEKRVALHSMLVAEPLTLNVALAAHRDIHQLKRRSLPVVVTAIDQLVDSSVEAALARNLSLHEPVEESIEV